ncbi:hypothetical protein BDA96_02G095800 [Sorghum bicolor]|uniref:Late embryogenesis abundant protein LEA-2 subgroup domain-containing protein n=1 Tax=Sorghum bicolor TaxID=4558 RepID=A0A921US64_SORBI|nr:hypothetical protein BDA96_02G095800 [Sorghum bicolor]
MGNKLSECWDDCCYKWDEWKYCLLCVAIVAGVVLLAVLLAAYGFVRHLDISVDDASLTRFELSTSPVTSLSYNLPLPHPGDPQPELGDGAQEHQAAGGAVQVRRPGVRPVPARRQGRQAPRREDPRVPPVPRRHHQGRHARERRRGRVPQGERHGDVPGRGGRRRGGPVHGAIHQVQGRGVVPAQAAARAAAGDGGGRRRVPEGQVQARRAGEELLARSWTCIIAFCLLCAAVLR